MHIRLQNEIDLDGKVEIIDQRLFKDVIGKKLTEREKRDFLIFEPRRFLTKRIDLPAYIQFNENKMVHELEQFLGNAGGFTGEMHFDCLVSPVAKWLRRKKWGFDKKTQKYAAFVRDGQMTREQAMERAEGPDAEKEPEILEDFMKMLNITRADVERSRKLSAMNFKHYDSRVIRMIGKITGLIDKEYK